MAKNRFFISYRRADAPEIARKLHDQLGLQYGRTNVFLDTKDIERGKRWMEVVESEVDSSDVVVVLIGPRWLPLLNERDEASDVLRFEIRTALERNKQIIPVLVSQAVMPAPEELPESIRPLAEIQAMRMSLQNFDRDLRQLVGRVKPSWMLGLHWAIANLVGGFLGVSFSALAAIAANGLLGEDSSRIEVAGWMLGIAAAGAIFGVSMGAAQWLVIRHWIEHARRLMFIYGALDATGLALVSTLLRFDEGGIWSKASAGIVVVLCLTLAGIGLWLVLRQQLQGAGWWCSLNVVAPFVFIYIFGALDVGWGWLFQEETPEPSSSLLFLGWFLGFLVPGLLLVYQMRRSELEPI